MKVVKKIELHNENAEINIFKDNEEFFKNIDNDDNYAGNKIKFFTQQFDKFHEAE